jgi:hypothetical protein
MLSAAQDPREKRGDPADERSQDAEDRLLDPVDHRQKNVHVRGFRSTRTSCPDSEAL